MGWASGSKIFDDVIKAVKANVPDVETRKKIYSPIVESFRDMDWDTLDECLELDDAYDEIYNEIYPPEDEAE